MVFGPAWFLGIDSLLDAVFLFVTGVVALMGYRAWRFFHKERYRLFATGFFLLSLSYAVLAISNFLIYLNAGAREAFLIRIIEIDRAITWGMLLHAALFLAGLLVLLFLYLQITDRRVRVLLFVLVLFALALGGHVSHLFHVLLAILLLFIIFEIARTTRKKRTVAQAMVLSGFIFVLAGEALLGALFLNPVLYVFSNLVTLCGFLCILASRLVCE